MAFDNLTIIGAGLLGGSIGLGLRACASPCKIVGYGYRRETLQQAQEFGAIDRWTLDLGEAVADADLVILCTPVGLFEAMFKQLSGVLKSGTVVTDVGSTKRSVVRLAQSILPDCNPFVGSHPMAGSEKRGVEYARADLFHNALCILTPTASSPRAVVTGLEGFWKSLGMRTIRLSPEEHDAAVSDISHLPHVLAAALVAMQSRSALPLVGKGFMDTTRIASGDASLWRDIVLDNRDNILASLGRLQKELATLRKLLTPAKSEALTAWLGSAAGRRDELARAKLREIADE
jgi:prephenate dehydrogenase